MNYDFQLSQIGRLAAIKYDITTGGIERAAPQNNLIANQIQLENTIPYLTDCPAMLKTP